MNDKERIKDYLIEREEFLNKIIGETGKSISEAPEGTIRIHFINGKSRYYFRKKPNERNGHYLKQTDSDLAVRLAQKSYDLRVMRAAEEEIKSIRTYLKLLPKASVEEVYDSLNPARKMIVIPAAETDEMFRDRWSSQKYIGKPITEENTGLVSDHGERVRSKSELIIANMLAKMNIPYRYECPVVLKGIGTVYPDFTVLNVRLRKEILWEHFGMMDNPEYAGKSVKKYNAYTLNGYIPGERLIMTFETGDMPLNVRQLKTIIENYCL